MSVPNPKYNTNQICHPRFGWVQNVMSSSRNSKQKEQSSQDEFAYPFCAKRKQSSKKQKNWTSLNIKLCIALDETHQPVNYLKSKMKTTIRYNLLLFAFFFLGGGGWRERTVHVNWCRDNVTNLQRMELRLHPIIHPAAVQASTDFLMSVQFSPRAFATPSSILSKMGLYGLLDKPTFVEFGKPPQRK